MDKSSKKMLRRGISELVVILIIVVIAVVAGLAIRAWLSAQMAKTPTTEMATAEWSASYGGNLWIVTVRIKNNLDRAIFLNATEVTLNDGSYILINYPTTGSPTVTATGIASTSVAVKTPTTAPVSIGPKSDITVIFTVSTQSSNPPKTIVVTVTDSTTRATSKIQAVGGVQY
jgi:flagellar basal body-associated protein FliL